MKRTESAERLRRRRSPGARSASAKPSKYALASGAELRVIDDARHLVNVERAEEFNDVLLAHL